MKTQTQEKEKKDSLKLKTQNLVRRIYDLFFPNLKNKKLNKIINSSEFVRQINILNNQIFLLKRYKKIMFENNSGIALKTVVLKTNRNEMNQLLLSGDSYDYDINDKTKINNKSSMVLLTYVYDDKECLEKNDFKSINIKLINNIRLKSESPKSGDTYRYCFDILNEEEISKENLEILIKSQDKPHLKRNLNGKIHEELIKQKLEKEYTFVEKIDAENTNNLKKLIDSLFKEIVKTNSIKSTTADFYCYNKHSDYINLMNELNDFKSQLELGSNDINDDTITVVKNLFKEINNIIKKNNIKLYSVKKLKILKDIDKNNIKEKLIKDLPNQLKENNLIKVVDNTKSTSKSPTLNIETLNNNYKFRIRISDFKGEKKDGSPIYAELNCSSLGITMGKINPKIFNYFNLKIGNDYENIVKCFENLKQRELSFTLNIMRGTFLDMEYIH